MLLVQLEDQRSRGVSGGGDGGGAGGGCGGGGGGGGGGDGTGGVAAAPISVCETTQLCRHFLEEEFGLSTRLKSREALERLEQLGLVEAHIDIQTGLVEAYVPLPIDAAIEHLKGVRQAMQSKQHRAHA